MKSRRFEIIVDWIMFSCQRRMFDEHIDLDSVVKTICDHVSESGLPLIYYWNTAHRMKETGCSSGWRDPDGLERSVTTSREPWRWPGWWPGPIPGGRSSSWGMCLVCPVYKVKWLRLCCPSEFWDQGHQHQWLQASPPWPPTLPSPSPCSPGSITWVGQPWCQHRQRPQDNLLGSWSRVGDVLWDDYGAGYPYTSTQCLLSACGHDSAVLWPENQEGRGGEDFIASMSIKTNIL